MLKKLLSVALLTVGVVLLSPPLPASAGEGALTEVHSMLQRMRDL